MNDEAPEEDGSVVIQGERIVPGTEILIKGKRGKFRFKFASVTSSGRVVVNTIGPIGFHQAFRTFYVEDVKIPKKPRRRRRVG